MNNFKVNQPRTSGLLVINNVGHACVTYGAVAADRDVRHIYGARAVGIGRGQRAEVADARNR